MDLPGYSDGLEELQPGTTLVDASDSLGHERFWPVILMNVGAAEAAVGAIDVDSADFKPLMDVLEERLRWWR